MSDDIARSVASMLRETEASHGAYEIDILSGNRDDDWAGWYAIHLFDRGIGQLVPELIGAGAAGLAEMLTQLDADFRREQPITDWPEFYARQLITAMKSG